MSDRELLERMRADWNRRAGEDAHYYVAFGRRGQDQAEFLATAADVVRALTRELRRLPPPRPGQPRRALEIGCGPGRLMRPLSRHFTEIHGVDVSDEMVRLGRERLRDIPHARVHRNDGAAVDLFADEYFDFAYSYAVFQHIPSREVVFRYLREMRRVLRTGGYMRCQINGLPASAKAYDTWHGVRISAAEIVQFGRANDLQLLALEGTSTQYMWTTLRKRPRGWRPQAAARKPQIVRITNAYSSEPLVPNRGRFACVSLWLEGLSEDCDLDHLEAAIGGSRAEPYFIGPPEVDCLQQLNIALPPSIGTGLMPVELLWLGQPLAPTVFIRVVPAGPTVPRLISVTDGVSLLSGSRIVSRFVKLILEEVFDPGQVRASVDGVPVEEIDYFCTDPWMPKCEVNLTLPAAAGPGRHELSIQVGSRRFAPVPIEIAGSS